MKSGEATAAQVGFIVLHDGVTHFEGNTSDLVCSRDSFLQQFLYKTVPPW